MDSERFQITLTDATVRATEMYIGMLDRQTAELDDQSARLKALRAHAARTIGSNPVGATRMQRVLNSTDRQMKEGNGTEIAAELATETELALAAMDVLDADVTGQIPE